MRRALPAVTPGAPFTERPRDLMTVQTCRAG